jgi:cytochrome c553
LFRPNPKSFPARLTAAVATLAAGILTFEATAQAPAPMALPLSPITLEGDVARGEVLAETCNGCHGVPEYHNAYPPYHVPKLGGQNADYLEVALQGYRRGTRSHPTMRSQASSLSDQDIADVAAYFAAREGEPATGRSSAAALQIEEGKKKSTTCVPCHGELGVSPAPQWPNLAGQHESYLLQALGQYKRGERSDALMAPIISGLDPAEFNELAAYFSSQQHLHHTQAE